MTILLLSMGHHLKANGPDPVEGWRLCHRALTGCRAEQQILHSLIQEYKKDSVILIRQRDEANDRALKAAQTGLPWYFYLTLGVAGGFVLSQTVRR